MENLHILYTLVCLSEVGEIIYSDLVNISKTSEKTVSCITQSLATCLGGNEVVLYAAGNSKLGKQRIRTLKQYCCRIIVTEVCCKV